MSTPPVHTKLVEFKGKVKGFLSPEIKQTSVTVPLYVSVSAVSMFAFVLSECYTKIKNVPHICLDCEQSLMFLCKVTVRET